MIMIHCPAISEKSRPSFVVWQLDLGSTKNTDQMAGMLQNMLNEHMVSIHVCHRFDGDVLKGAPVMLNVLRKYFTYVHVCIIMCIHAICTCSSTVLSYLQNKNAFVLVCFYRLRCEAQKDRKV